MVSGGSSYTTRSCTARGALHGQQNFDPRTSWNQYQHAIPHQFPSPMSMQGFNNMGSAAPRWTQHPPNPPNTYGANAYAQVPYAPPQQMHFGLSPQGTHQQLYPNQVFPSSPQQPPYSPFNPQHAMVAHGVGRAEHAANGRVPASTRSRHEPTRADVPPAVDARRRRRC